ncbi:Positive regulator of purine utilization [Colletotrichum siamense]|nr:Positive regulator of purine utilization [Colletotrichum siamense]
MDIIASPKSKRHRSIPACARCHKSKQKCDRGTPRCLRCVSAGVECTAINRQNSSEVPRSAVQYLEQKLAELETRATTREDVTNAALPTQDDLNINASEIHATQFFDQSLPDYVKDHADWTSKTNEAVQRLANEATLGSLVDPWLTSAPYQCRVLLHRPCSRNIVVSDESLLAVVIAATNLIALDMNVAKAGGLVMAFEIGNRNFQAGMVLLYALRNHSAKLEEASLTVAAERALSDLVQLFNLLSSRWPPLADTAAYINELGDTNLRNPVGHSGSAYDMNVLEELDCLVTQRRIHSIRHRNVVLPQQKKSAAAATQPRDSGQEMGEGLFEDENWWRDFINDDLVTNDSPFSLISPDAAQSSVSILPHERIQHQPDPRRDLSDLEKQLRPIIDALPSCSFCRDRRIKCRLQLPACKECHRTSRNCVVYDPILGSNVPLKYVRKGFPWILPDC